MNPTTTVTVDGAKVELTFESAYRVRFRRDRILEATLVRRERNGDLVFERPDLSKHSSASTDVETRIRTRDLVSIFPIAAPEPVTDVERELAKRSVVSPRKDGETARDYLRRLERGLGTGSYARWIETELGQTALAAAAAEDQDARRRAAKVPETGVPVSVEIAPRGRRILADQAAQAIVGRSRGADLSPEEEARRAANRAREMARNTQWTCATCHRRTRQASCSNGHATVEAPAGTRRDAK